MELRKSLRLPYLFCMLRSKIRFDFLVKKGPKIIEKTALPNLVNYWETGPISSLIANSPAWITVVLP